MFEKAILDTIFLLARLLMPSDAFVRITACVERWDDKFDPDGIPLSGDEKKAGVLDEIELLGIHAAQWLVQSLVQLAVLNLRLNQGNSPDITITKPK